MNYIIKILDLNNSSQNDLKLQQANLFEKLIEREREFSFNPNIIVNYPDITINEGFLYNPIAYIEKICQNKIDIAKVTILTTFGDILFDRLVACGYSDELIYMPAGPENTYKFSKVLDKNLLDSTNRHLYIECVNEQDPKIYPTFVAMMEDINGKLSGGMSGSIYLDNQGIKYAYIATVVVNPNLAKGVGSFITKAVLEYLEKQGVKLANLGTQTAGNFYEKHGFETIHHIIPNLRTRTNKEGKKIMNDLIIMQKNFK